MSRIVAQHVVDGMVLSNANMYFTAHDGAGATVFRTAQSATPGQETQLCHEPGCRFGDIVWAKVDEVFYGYFFTLAGGVTTIRRIPLAPQPGQVAEIIGPPIADIDIASSHGNLVTDGSFLYWQSDTAVSKMPVRGGTVTVLDTTPLTRPVTGLHLVGPDVVYAVGRSVYHVSANGPEVPPPSLRILFTVATGVAAYAPLAGSLFVADRNGAIVWHSSDGSGQVKQAPGTAFITSMAYDGAHSALTWTQMSATWQVHLDAGVNSITFTTGANPRLAMFNPGGDLFWVNDDGVIASH